jgi:hypothetical protein
VAYPVYKKYDYIRNTICNYHTLILKVVEQDLGQLEARLTPLTSDPRLLEGEDKITAGAL